MTRRHCDAVTRLRVASFNIRMETSEPDPMDRVWRVGEVGKKWCTLEVVEWRKQVGLEVPSDPKHAIV